MPILFQKKYSWGVVAAWKIKESEEELMAHTTASDLESIQNISSSVKRVERLSWRALLRSLISDAGDVVYDKYGAPHIDYGYLSVSHNSEYAVVAISQSERCAVDIELCARNFEKVASRYISRSEEEFLELSNLTNDDRQRALCAIWCAKEVLYKYSGVDGLDLLNNLKINSYEDDIIFGEICYDGEITLLKMDVVELGDSLLVVGTASVKS